MNLLSRDAILAVSDIAYKNVPVPEWGGEVRLRAISAASRDDLEQAAYDANKNNKQFRNLRARMLSLCIVDENGKQIFSDTDIEALGEKSAAAVDRLYAASLKLNAMSVEDIKELEKNLPAAQGGDSLSASQNGLEKPSAS
jgi:hypothetical protein